MDVRWRIELLGGLRAEQDNHVLTRFRTQKTGALLAYLAYYRLRSHLRDALIERLWSDRDLSAGRNNLSRELSWLRQQLEPSGVPPGAVIAADRTTIRLNSDAITTDVAAFEAALQSAERAGTPAERAQHLTEAIETYGSQLLPGYYDDWILQEREWLAERYFQALGQLLAHLERAGDLARAVKMARRGVSADPLREEAHVALIRLSAAAGQPAAALRQYRLLEELLQKEFGAIPTAATRALAAEIERLHNGSPPQLPPPPLRRHNLPLQLTSFIGREPQIAEVCRLSARHRLVTLVGAGGCGKTRLALRVADELLISMADGIWFVEFAALVDPAFVPHRVAATLDVQEEPGRSVVDTLIGALKARELLLVLDNCEHLVGACAELTEALVRACPHLRILATSREALGIGGEQTYRVPSLTMPDARHLPPLERLHAFETVQLFSDRARLNQATFTVTQGNALAVAQVCQRLDGIPLAIELAAARMQLLSVEQIAARLEDRFQLLTGGSRTALPRHQTLRATMDWSYGLLSDPERTLLRRMAVFAGGWTLEAAEAVCAGDGIDACEVMDLLSQLVDKSLVVAEAQGEEARYQLLETIRQFGAEKLRATDERVVVRARHRDWFLGLVEEAEPHLAVGTDTDPATWVERLEQEHENLRAALSWSQEREEAEPFVRLAGALWQFWEWQGYGREGRLWLEAALKRRSRVPATAWVKVLFGAGVLAWAQGDWAVARERYEESLTIFREAGDQENTAQVVHNLGVAALRQDDLASAAALFEESLALRRELADRQGIASSLLYQGRMALSQGEYAVAQSCYEESLAICRELQDKRGSVRALDWLRIVSVFQGNYEAAQARIEEILVIQREIGNKRDIASSIGLLGDVPWRRGDYAAARARYEESLVLQQELGDKVGIARTLIGLGNVASLQGDYAAARARYEESQAISRELGHKVAIAWSFMYLGRMALDEGDYATARSLCEEGLAHSRQIGAKLAIAWFVCGLGRVDAYQGDYAQGRMLCEKGMAIYEQVGDVVRRTLVLNDMGAMACEHGDYTAAQSYYEEGLALFRKLGVKPKLADTLASLGKVAARQGDYEGAIALYRESLGLRWEMGTRRGLAESLERLAEVAGAQRQPDRAARLFGAAQALREGIGAPLPPPERADYERAVAAVRAQFGEGAFAAAWAAGRAMSLDDAAGFVLEGCDTSSDER